MHEEQGFLDQLREHPEDDVTRLVYADWLEDQGDRRSAYLRAEVALARMKESGEGYASAEAELVGLREGIELKWLETASKRWDVVFLGQGPAHKIHAIKLVREIGGYGLAESKSLVESAPTVFLIAAPRYEAEVARQYLMGNNPRAQVRVRLAPHRSTPEETVSKARELTYSPVRWRPSMLDHLPRLADAPLG